MSKRITLIYATPLSIKPIEDAFEAGWPEAERVNLLEDSLSRDRAKTKELTDAIYERFEILGDYAAGIGSDAILFTCSAFGRAIERVQDKLDIPVLKPNEAMLEAALETGSRIGLVATFPATIDSMTEEIEEMAAARGVELELHTRLAAGAMDFLNAGDGERHDRLIVEAASDLPEVDVILLAQFSMAQAQPKVAVKTSAPVLTAPDTAVSKLYRVVCNPAAA